MTSAPAIALLLAIASGLAVIAFKAPRIFLRMVFPLIWLLLLVQAITIAWDIGFQQAYVAFSKFIPKEQSDAAALALKEGLIPFSITIYLSAATVFIGFLNWLSHQVIEHAKDREPKKEVHGK